MTGEKTLLKKPLIHLTNEVILSHSDVSSRMIVFATKPSNTKPSNKLY